jgi:hypothetical protein
MENDTTVVLACQSTVTYETVPVAPFGEDVFGHKIEANDVDKKKKFPWASLSIVWIGKSKGPLAQSASV